MPISLRADEPVKNTHKFEDLFIWKISDELKLSVSEEKAFSDLIHRLSQQKAQLNDQLQAIIAKMKESSGSIVHGTSSSVPPANAAKDLATQLVSYKTTVKKLNNLALEEIDQVKKILGNNKVAQYLVLKNELSTQFKSKLINSDAHSAVKPDLKAPQIIEEQ